MKLRGNNILGLSILGVLVVAIFGFTNHRNSYRNLTGIDVEFVDENEPFISRSSVNKLLIQNDDSVASIVKETLDLNEIEQRLLSDPMIRNAEVFVSVEGVLGARIEQRNPIARVTGIPDFYLDADGKKMPLSKVYSARVPLVTGTSENDFTELTPLLLAIDADAFMRSIVVGVHARGNGEVMLRMRKHDFQVRFGQPEMIARKFQNFKAFYKKTKQDTLISNYTLIDLRYGNQVVATKK